MLFDKHAWKMQRERAAAGFAQVDFLKRIAAQRVADKIADTTRSFEVACDLGGHHGEVMQEVALVRAIPHWVMQDVSPRMLEQVDALLKVQADEEWLPYAEASFDVITSALGMHYANDMAGVLAQALRCLRSEGLFIGVVFGGQTLWELREVLSRAEVEITGGVSPRVASFVDVRDAGDVLARVGYQLPVADSEHLTITYADMFALMRELRAMGESNILDKRQKSCTRRAIVMRAAELYQQIHADAEGRIQVTVELVTLTGWKPAVVRLQA